MVKQFTLHKAERVKSRKVIEQLFAAGRSFSLAGLRVYYLLAPVPATLPGIANTHLSDPLQAGMGVSKRHFKKAVHRNRIKRLLREAYRLQKLPLQEALANNPAELRVFFIFTGKELPLFEFVQQQIAAALKRLHKEVLKPQ